MIIFFALLFGFVGYWPGFVVAGAFVAFFVVMSLVRRAMVRSGVDLLEPSHDAFGFPRDRSGPEPEVTDQR